MSFYHQKLSPLKQNEQPCQHRIQYLNFPKRSEELLLGRKVSESSPATSGVHTTQL